MNILITTPISPPEIGGPATYLSGLIPKLAQNHQVTVITFTSKPNLPQAHQIIAIPQHKHLFGSLFRQARLFIQIINLARHSDLIYAQGPLVVGLASSLAARLLDKPLVLKFVGDIPWETARTQSLTDQKLENFYQQPNSFHLKLLISFQRLSFRLASHMIVPSKYLRNFLVNIHGVSPSKLSVISNPIEIKSKPFTSKPLQLIFVGRLVPWKNIDQIILAVHLARKVKPWKLQIIGEGSELKTLKLLVKKLNGSSWVTFLGRLPQTQTQRKIVESQKLILYSDYEGLSHTLIEAMLLKTQIIASDIPANHEVTGDFAQFAPLDNPQALAKAINQSSAHQQSAYNFAKSRYSWDIHLKKLLETFTQLK